MDSLSFGFVNGYIIVGGNVKATDATQCGIDMLKGEVTAAMQCRVVAVAPTSIYFDSDKTNSIFGCALGSSIPSFKSSLPMYFACAVFNSKGKVAKWKARDLFKEKTGCPVWVIWLAITIGCVLIVVLSCWCCCKCCCGKKRKGCCK